MTDLRASYQPGRVAGGVLDPDLGRLTTAERVARGKAARAAVPRDSHAVFDPPADRPDPVAQLAQQAESRVAELVPIRYGRMLVSPFAYFRGAALPMASDLASTPCTGLVVQACGDAHLSNFGIFASPERKFLFDVNDFDETLPGPWEWDVKRLAASLEVAGRGNGFSRKQRRRVVTASTRMYRETMRTFAAMSNIDVWYARVDLDLVQKMFSPRMAPRHRRGLARNLARNLAKARTRDSMQAFSKLCGVVDGQTRIIADPPLIMPVSHLRPEERDELGFEAQLDEMLARYGGTLNGAHRILFQRYQLVDLARKVVGVGSVGTRCWIFLFTARDGTEPLLLQVKEAQPSVLAAFAGSSKYDHQGQRVVEGQWLIQPVSDIFLGWQRSAPTRDGKTHDFYVRQLRDWKFSLDVDGMEPPAMAVYGELCAWTLARSHARSGDSVAIAAYLGNADVFEQAITQFASSYADQTERDHQALAKAAATGRIIAHRGL
ncbi:MAG: DUF2252 domain-containing protein [Streptosporangiaceae bacterium]